MNKREEESEMKREKDTAQSKIKKIKRKSRKFLEGDQGSGHPLIHESLQDEERNV